MPKRNIAFSPKLNICVSFITVFDQYQKHRYRSTERHLIHEKLMQLYSPHEIHEHNGRLWYQVDQEYYEKLNVANRNPDWINEFAKPRSDKIFGKMRTLKEVSNFLLEGNELVLENGVDIKTIWLSTDEQEDQAEKKASVLYNRMLQEYEQSEIEHAFRTKTTPKELLENVSFKEYLELGTPRSEACILRRT